MNICAIRMLGLGDVASIGVPAARWLKANHPYDHLGFLTYGAGAEIMRLVPEVDRVIAIEKEDWPDQLLPGLRAAARVGQRLVDDGVDLVVNFDTWFLPCLMTRTLQDAGMPIAGNTLRWSITELVERIESGKIDQATVLDPARFATSTFPHFEDWLRPWWEDAPHAGPYPDYYLRHVCDLQGPLDASLDVTADEVFRASAGGRPIVALALEGRTETRRYPYAIALRDGLEHAGFHVWSRFDGSQSMVDTLAQLRASDLLISVASAPQWLARAVGCPTLVLPGTVPPAVLGAEATIERQTDCQYCMQMSCVEDRSFACLDVPPPTIVAQARALIEASDSQRAAA